MGRLRKCDRIVQSMIYSFIPKKKIPFSKGYYESSTQALSQVIGTHKGS